MARTLVGSDVYTCSCDGLSLRIDSYGPHVRYEVHDARGAHRVRFARLDDPRERELSPAAKHHASEALIAYVDEPRSDDGRGFVIVDHCAER